MRSLSLSVVPTSSFAANPSAAMTNEATTARLIHVALGKVEGQVAQVGAITLAAGARIRQEAQVEQAPAHAGLGLRSAPIAARALSAAAVDRSRAASSASTVSPRLVSR